MKKNQNYSVTVIRNQLQNRDLLTIQQLSFHTKSHKTAISCFVLKISSVLQRRLTSEPCRHVISGLNLSNMDKIHIWCAKDKSAQ